MFGFYIVYNKSIADRKHVTSRYCICIWRSVFCALLKLRDTVYHVYRPAMWINRYG